MSNKYTKMLAKLVFIQSCINIATRMTVFIFLTYFSIIFRLILGLGVKFQTYNMTVCPNMPDSAIKPMDDFKINYDKGKVMLRGHLNFTKRIDNYLQVV